MNWCSLSEGTHDDSHGLSSDRLRYTGLLSSIPRTSKAKGLFMLCLFVEWTIKVLCIVNGRWKHHVNRHGCLPTRNTSSWITWNLFSRAQRPYSKLHVYVIPKQSLGFVYILLVCEMDDNVLFIVQGAGKTMWIVISVVIGAFPQGSPVHGQH